MGIDNLNNIVLNLLNLFIRIVFIYFKGIDNLNHIGCFGFTELDYLNNIYLFILYRF